MVQQQLTHYLNHMKHCCANLPLATCTAICMGKFCWMLIDQPGAFSLLACYHLVATSTTAFQVSGEDAVSMHLRSTEGLGLNEADILKATTKVVLYAPPDIDSLAKKTVGSLWDTLWSHFRQKIGLATGDGQMDHSHNKI
jgi:hypothetical protein